jgi:DNA-binding Lrp family transcriptional regulator
MKKTADIQHGRQVIRPLDDMDRRILGALAEDADRSYAELGRVVALSAPAVHERVKRLRAAGIIRSTVALIDGKRIGKPLLVFIHVTTQNWGHSQALDRLADLPEFEEVHSVTGDASIILKVRVADPEALEALLRQIHQLESVVSTKTFVTLSTYLERPTQAEVTAAWADPPLPPA